MGTGREADAQVEPRLKKSGSAPGARRGGAGQAAFLTGGAQFERRPGKSVSALTLCWRAPAERLDNLVRAKLNIG
jgi:hypothetical protein